MKKPIVFSVLLIGATAMAAQIILVRELIIVFYGNEISVGFILAGWLILGAIGSILFGGIADRLKSKLEIFAAAQTFLSASLPLSLILVRLTKKALGIIPGEIIGLGAALTSSIIILSGVCITLGFLFALSCRVYQFNNPATRIGKVYILEAVGAIFGGGLSSYFLIKHFDSIEILAGISILNIIAALSVSRGFSVPRVKKTFRSLTILWLAIFVALLARGSFQRMDKGLLKEAWKPLTLLSSQNSIYGNTTVTRNKNQVSFFSNGLYNFTVPDELTQEEIVHFAMLEHTQPEEVLLLGGGMGGPLWELLKYPVRRIDYVELDPLLIEMGETYLAGTQYFIEEDPRINILTTDGRFWVKDTSRKYDVIIVNLPNPFTAQLNRFYTLEFFKEIKRIMNPRAVFLFSVTSSENYISKELGMFLASITNTLERVFSDIKVIPGDTAYFVASNYKDLLTLDYNSLTERLKERGVYTKFISEHYLFAKMSPDRLDYIKESIEENSSARINRDFHPVSYYYDMALWSTHFESPLKKVLPFISESKIWLALILACAFLLLSYLLIKGRVKRPEQAILIAIGTTGFSEIAFEIAVILAFQVIYGFMYYKIGLIFTSFMAGLTLGSFYITRRLHNLHNDFRTFTKIQLCIVIYPLLLPPIFLFLAAQRPGIISWLGSNVIFPILPAIAGFIGGLQFPLGAKIFLGKEKRVGQAGGITYGVDLMGACIGAIIISSLLIPLLGIFKTCLAVSVLNLCVFILLSIARHSLDKTLEK